MSGQRRLARGVAAVEFALVLPVLLALLLGIFDYGYVFFVRLGMTNAAREGARVGVTRDEPAIVSAAAVEAAERYLQSAGIEAETSASEPSSVDPRVVVTVTVDDFQPLVGFVPTPSRMSVSSTMRWELAP